MQENRSYKDSYKQLYEIAESQLGLFTTKQAKRAGYAESTHPYHVKTGNWIRRHRGIYQLVQFPIEEDAELVLWSLWCRNRNETPEGVYSHQTALRIHGLSDINPAKFHMTVPRAFRRNSEIPKILVLHYSDLSKTDVEAGRGFSMTRPLPTILELLKTEAVSRDILGQALREGLQRGLITQAEIRNIKLSDALHERFQTLMREGRAA